MIHTETHKYIPWANCNDLLLSKHLKGATQTAALNDLNCMVFLKTWWQCSTWSMHFLCILSVVYIQNSNRYDAQRFILRQVLGFTWRRIRHLSPKHVTSSHCVGCEVLAEVVTKSSTFWDMTPCTPLKVNRRFGGDMTPPSSGSKNKPNKQPSISTQRNAASLAYSSAAKTEVVRSSEMASNFYHTIPRHTTEHSIQYKGDGLRIIICACY
jgi:hypothetical protein